MKEYLEKVIAIKELQKIMDTAEEVVKKLKVGNNMNELDLIIDKLPLQVDGHKLQIWREKGNTSWDVAYNTDSGNLRPIVWEQARYLSEAVDQMLKRLKVNCL